MEINMAEKREERPGKITVAEAGHKGGEKVRRLIKEGEEAKQREVKGSKR